MKKFFLAIAMLAGMFTSAMAQEASETKDSVYVVKGNYVVGSYEVGTDIDYVTFVKPEWKVLKEGVSTYLYNGTYNVNATYKTNIWQLGNENRYYIEDVLGSGVGAYFTITVADSAATTFKASDMSTWKGAIKFNDYFDCTDYGTYAMDYFLPGIDSENSYTWTDATNNVVYDYLLLYGDYEGYSKIEDNFMWAYGYVSISSGGTSGYTYYFIDWR